MGAVTQHVGPGTGRFAVAVGQGDQFLGAVGADADNDEQAQLVLIEAQVHRPVPVLSTCGDY
jgi:hypothetical protein